jgi:hypothetical protein
MAITGRIHSRSIWGLLGRPREIGKIELALAKRIGYVVEDGLRDV